MAEFDFERAESYLPHYLNPGARRSLFEQLDRVPLAKLPFYDPTSEFDETLLQGDGWRGLVAIDFATRAAKAVSGVIISNSCDIDIKNAHIFSRNVLFAPLIRVAELRALFADNGVGEARILEKLEIIRQQRISNIFFLPERRGIIDESIILLDDIHGHPLEEFVRTERTKLFTLTQAAFYVFLIKLSIHFHRVNEGIERHLSRPSV